MESITNYLITYSLNTVLIVICIKRVNTAYELCFYILVEGLFVKEVLSETSAHPFQVSHVIAEFLDVVHLFVKELTLNEVRELGIVSSVADALEVQKRLIDGALQL